MNAKLMQLQERRAMLVGRAQAQRAELSRHMSRLGSPVEQAERRWDSFQSWARSPLVIAAVTWAAFKLPWRKAIKLPGAAWTTFKVLRWTRGFLRRRRGRPLLRAL